jgi:hypothetical protein
MPAAAIDVEKKLWRTKGGKKTKHNQPSSYLFNHTALTKVFRAKMLDAIRQQGLELPARYPEPMVSIADQTHDSEIRQSTVSNHGQGSCAD